MAKKDSGCSAIILVGAALFFLGLLGKGCSGNKSNSTATTAYPQAGGYPSIPEAAPPQVKLPVARDGTVIANPEKYIPKTVIILKPVQVSVMDGQKTTGTKTLPAGTEVKLKAVDGYDAFIEVDGHWEVVKASATDLLDQMAQAAGGVE
jgi:peptidoglycan hydrolase-like protein with peptidoglycan-binding domain